MAKSIKTALCAYGMSGKLFHAPFIHLHEGYELYAVCERTKKEAKGRYPSAISYDTVGEMFNDAAIDLVIINTPNYTHFDFARKALLAGKHIVVEKPFCTTVAECDELIALAAEKGKLISVYQNRRWDSDFLTVRKVIEEKLLGAIVEAEIHFDRYDQNLSYKLHKETPGPGAGLLYDLGPHLIDQSLQLFGMPNAVFADLLSMRPASKVEDYMELILLYDKLRVRLKAGYLVREAPPAYIIHGNKGSFLKPRADVQESSLKQNMLPNDPNWGIEPETAMGLLHTEVNGNIVREKPVTERGCYAAYYEQLYKALTEGAANPVTAWEGRQVVHIIEKAFDSARERKIIDL